VVKQFTVCLLLFSLLGCTLTGGGVRVLKDQQILTDTVWQGEIVIDGAVRVVKGAHLTIQPGTHISFVRRDLDRDGLGDGTLIVEGSLSAIGTAAEPILFYSSEENPRPGDWLEIRVDFSKETVLRYCEIRDSAHTLHAHFTKGSMTDCVVRGNIDGSRLGEARFVLSNNLYEDNIGKAINFRNSNVEITHNIFRRNGSGIFLFETDRNSLIEQNNFYENMVNVRLGDFFKGEVRFKNNWWGTTDMKKIEELIHDSQDDSDIGTVSTAPASAWVADSGPRDSFVFALDWEYKTFGFVDAAVVKVGDRLVVGSWDGHLTALTKRGQVLWNKRFDNVIDATPAWDGERLYVQTWDRSFFALDPIDGHELWRFSYAPSASDDHRQASPLVVDNRVLLPTWNGTLYALDVLSGARLWQYDTGGALRAQPARDGERVYVGNSAGLLLALNLDGEVLWQVTLGAPLLSTPAVTAAGPIVVLRSGDVVALDHSGRKRWIRRLGEVCFYSAPLYADASVFVGTAAGTLWRLRASDGEPIWSKSGFGPIYATPTLHKNRLYFGDNDGNLSVVNIDSGTVSSRFKTDGEIQGKPLIFGQQLLFGARNHYVYSLLPADIGLETP
jgi:outer membrane protein assembly factor BamB